MPGGCGARLSHFWHARRGPRAHVPRLAGASACAARASSAGACCARRPVANQECTIFPESWHENAVLQCSRRRRPRRRAERCSGVKEKPQVTGLRGRGATTASLQSFRVGHRFRVQLGGELHFCAAFPIFLRLWHRDATRRVACPRPPSLRHPPHRARRIGVRPQAVLGTHPQFAHPQRHRESTLPRAPAGRTPLQLCRRRAKPPPIAAVQV